MTVVGIRMKLVLRLYAAHANLKTNVSALLSVTQAMRVGQSALRLCSATVLITQQRLNDEIC